MKYGENKEISARVTRGRDSPERRNLGFIFITPDMMTNAVFVLKCSSTEGVVIKTSLCLTHGA